MLGEIIVGVISALGLAAIWWLETRWSRDHPGQCHSCGEPAEHDLCDDCHQASQW